jgi:hypothetical protein
MRCKTNDRFLHRARFGRTSAQGPSADIQGRREDRLSSVEIRHSRFARPVMPVSAVRSTAAGGRKDPVGWLPALGTGGFHHPPSESRADLRLRVHKSTTAGSRKNPDTVAADCSCVNSAPVLTRFKIVLSGGVT